MLLSFSAAIILVTPVLLTYTGLYPSAFDYLNEATLLDTEYNGSIQFSENQIDTINDNWNSSTEVGFCMRVEDGKVTDLENVDEKYTESDSAEFSCDPGSYWNSRVHTHPGLLGVPELSNQDSVAHDVGQAFGNRKVDCVVSRSLVEKKDRPVSMNCFSRTQDDQGVNETVFRYNIEVVES